jgi:hypothetical protein
MIKYTSILFIPLILSGCMGIYEGGFECPPGSGIKCKSISEVNELINKGAFPSSEIETVPSPCPHSSCQVNEEEFLRVIKKPVIWWAPWEPPEIQDPPPLHRDTPYERHSI